MQHGLCADLLLHADREPHTPEEWQRWHRTTRKAITRQLIAREPGTPDTTRLMHAYCQRRGYPTLPQMRRCMNIRPGGSASAAAGLPFSRRRVSEYARLIESARWLARNWLAAASSMSELSTSHWTARRLERASWKADHVSRSRRFL
jgi:hypothetical protein